MDQTSSYGIGTWVVIVQVFSFLVHTVSYKYINEQSSEKERFLGINPRLPLSRLLESDTFAVKGDGEKGPDSTLTFNVFIRHGAD